MAELWFERAKTGTAELFFGEAKTGHRTGTHRNENGVQTSSQVCTDGLAVAVEGFCTGVGGLVTNPCVTFRMFHHAQDQGAMGCHPIAAQTV